MTLNDGDFVRLDFTGYEDETDEAFDTTREDAAKEHDLHNEQMEYEPVVVCVGQGHVLPGLDDALTQHEAKDTFSVTLAPEEAFGKKQADMLKLMPLKEFKKQGIKPEPGLELRIDGSHGKVKSVTGNRVIVDFNHPLSGKTLRYECETKGVVEDTTEQVQSLVGRALRFTPDVEIEEGAATITVPTELPKQLRDELTEQVTTLTSVEDVAFTQS